MAGPASIARRLESLMGGDSKKRLSDFNSTTVKLLLVVAAMAGAIVYLLTLPAPLTVVTTEDEVQTQTYLNASGNERELLVVRHEDFEAQYYEVAFMNPQQGKVLVVVNGSKVKTVQSNAYIDLMLESLDADMSPFYYVFLSYFLASLSFPAGTISFFAKSTGVYYNGNLYPESSPLFKRLCILLVSPRLASLDLGVGRPENRMLQAAQ